MAQNFISEPSDSIKKYRTEIPNIIDDMNLSVYAFRVYFHLKRVAGANGGSCWEGTRAIANACKMSVGATVAAKKELAEKGLVIIETRNPKQKETDIVTIVDIWERNFGYFAERNKQSNNTTVHCMNARVHYMNSDINTNNTVNSSNNKDLTFNSSNSSSVHDTNSSNNTTVHCMNERKNKEEEYKNKNKNIHVELPLDGCVNFSTGSQAENSLPVQEAPKESEPITQTIDPNQQEEKTVLPKQEPKQEPKPKKRKPLVFTPMAEFREPVNEIFGFWKQTMGHPGAILGSERGTPIQNRLLQGYTVEQIKQAVLGCKASPHHMGLNPQSNPSNTIYDDIELICRSAKHLESFIGRYQASQPKAKPEPTSSLPPQQARPLSSLEKMALIDQQRKQQVS